MAKLITFPPHPHKKNLTCRPRPYLQKDPVHPVAQILNLKQIKVIDNFKMKFKALGVTNHLGSEGTLGFKLHWYSMFEKIVLGTL